MHFPDTPFGPAWSAHRRRADETELRAWVDAALGWADEADLMAREAFGRPLEISTKPDTTLVTAVDTAIERLIRDRIAEQFPDHGIVGEEFGVAPGTHRDRWYVDPIDGTHNFVRGVPVFATLLAIEREGELQAGVVSAPALQRRWFAWRGGGAWVLEPGSAAPRRIQVSRIASLEDAQILSSSPIALLSEPRIPGFAALIRSAWRERAFGDFWGYMLVAEGAAEGMIEIGVEPYDIAAPTIILEEAGGSLTDVDGVRRLDGRSSLGSNGALHQVLLGRLHGP